MQIVYSHMDPEDKRWGSEGAVISSVAQPAALHLSSPDSRKRT